MSTLATKLPLVARIGLGLILTVFGVNGFLQFLPQPERPDAASTFLEALAATGYIVPLFRCTQLLGGALLLAGRAVPFALTILAPVIVNIMAFHLVLDTTGLGIAATLCALEVYLAWIHRAAFTALFQLRGAPSAVELNLSV